MSEKVANTKKPKLTLLLLLLLLIFVDFSGGCGSAQPPPSAPPASPFPNEYAVLIKICKSEEEACIVGEQLREARINNSRIPKIHSGDKIWLVYVNKKYFSEKSAQRIADYLKNLGWSEAVVLSPKRKL